MKPTTNLQQILHNTSEEGRKKSQLQKNSSVKLAVGIGTPGPANIALRNMHSQTYCLENGSLGIWCQGFTSAPRQDCPLAQCNTVLLRATHLTKSSWLKLSNFLGSFQISFTFAVQLQRTKQEKGQVGWEQPIILCLQSSVSFMLQA